MALWKKYGNPLDAVGDMPIEGIPEDKHSIPDVYGKAIQLYFALKESYDHSEQPMEEVLLWRGLLALLALKDYLDFPLNWEKVSLQKDRSAFSSALQYVPQNFAVFPQNSQAAWNGSDFCVLTWGKEHEKKEDLLLYSPATLVYPVAAWRNIFSRLPGIRWFDREARRFADPVGVLEEHEKKIVFYWLQEMRRNVLQQSGEAATVVLHHLNNYITDLKINLTPCEARCMDWAEIEGSGECADAVGHLRQSVRVRLYFGKNEPFPANRFFAEQLCCFKIGDKNPFSRCADSERYAIQNGDNLYALLPLHSSLRKYCLSHKLAGGVHMKRVTRNGQAFIRVGVKMPDTMYGALDLIKEYPLYDKEPDDVPLQKDIAVLCPSEDGKLPIIAIWPGKICKAWKKYYVFLEDPYSMNSSLEIGEAGSCAGGNSYAAQVSYMPEAIPIEKAAKKQRISIGMLTLPVSPIPDGAAAVSADVAVDFGTSSTRVFYKISGQAEKCELHIMEDSPLIVMGGRETWNVMRTNFVAPSPEGVAAPSEENLFSIYRRSTSDPMSKAEPILDGVIYRAEKSENVESYSYFMPDLKWGVCNNRTYFEAFIKQLCVHVMVILYKTQSVTHITWKYALPESMLDLDQNAMAEAWTKIHGYLTDMAGSIQNTLAPRYIMESEAASRYFLFDKDGVANTEKGYLVADIGGGSSDIALWQGNAETNVMKWHSSVNIAGRRMFTQWIGLYLVHLSGMVNSEDLKAMVGAAFSSQISPEMRTALVERILNQYERDLKNAYDEEIKNQPAGWGTALCAKINLGVSMLMFAMGCQTGRLIHDGALAVPDGEGSFVIAVGGNGSKMLDWTRCRNGVWEFFFRKGAEFAKGPIDSTVEIQKSGDPKAEVAKGLLDTHTITAEASQTRSGEELSVPDCLEAVKQFQKAYNQKFHARHTGVPALPKLEINFDHIANKLNQYKNCQQGMLQGGIVKIFMEYIYPCVAERGTDLPPESKSSGEKGS